MNWLSWRETLKSCRRKRMLESVIEENFSCILLQIEVLYDLKVLTIINNLNLVDFFRIKNPSYFLYYIQYEFYVFLISIF